MGEKRIDLDTLQKEIKEADRAVKEFDPCYREFIASVMECMDRNNSDFMEAFEKLLRTFLDDKVRKSWEAVSCYSEDVKAVYPIWWGDMPMAVYSFLDEYDLSGKTVLPFCTHGGSGLSQTDINIQDEEGDAKVTDGLAISDSSLEDVDEDIDRWLKSNGVTK